jgi:hypothetical protein
MAKFGMQMPAARGKKPGGPNVYTILAATACLALAAACFFVLRTGMTIAPDGNPFAVHKAGQPIKLKPLNTK